MVDALVSGTSDSNIMEVRTASRQFARPETLRANAPELRWGRGPNANAFGTVAKSDIISS